MKQTKPNFFIVGAPKSGTTALSEYLRRHPRIFMSRPKEPFFFCSDFPRLPGPKSLDEYLSLFAGVSSEALAIGEASTLYLFSEVAIDRIQAFDPAAQIVVMLRNPIDLAPAFHSQLCYETLEDVSEFETAWRLQAERLEGGRLPRRCLEPKLLQYRAVASLGSQVERLLDRFPREQVLVLWFDEFVRDPRSAYESTLGFLGISSDGRREFPKVNENRAPRSATVARWSKSTPPPLSRVARDLKRTLGLEELGILDPLRRLVSPSVPRKALEPSLRSELEREFGSEIDRLARVLGADLSRWLRNPSSLVKTGSR